MREEEQQQQQATRRRRRRSPSEVYKTDVLLHPQPGLHRYWPARRLSAPGAQPRRLSSSPPMDYRNVSENCKELTVPCSNSSSLPASVSGTDSSAGQRTAIALGRPAAANAARERSRVQTLRHAFLELQRTLPSVPPDTKLSKLDVLLLATTYIAHLTRSLQDEDELPGEGLGTLRGDGYLHPVKKWPMRSRLYIGATGQFLSHSAQTENTNQGETSTNSQM